MQFTCLGYSEQKKWDAMSRAEQESKIEECLNYDFRLLDGGHWIGCPEALQETRTAKILPPKDRKFIVTDGPYAETKEQFGGFGIVKAENVDQAVEPRAAAG